MNDMIFAHFTHNLNLEVYGFYSREKNTKVCFFTLFLLWNCSTIHEIHTIVCVCFVYPHVLCVCACVREGEYCIRLCLYMCVVASVNLWSCLHVCWSLHAIHSILKHHTLSEGWLWTNMHACGSVYACIWNSCVCTYACVIVNLCAFVYMCISLCFFMHVYVHNILCISGGVFACVHDIMSSISVWISVWVSNTHKEKSKHSILTLQFLTYPSLDRKENTQSISVSLWWHEV